MNPTSLSIGETCPINDSNGVDEPKEIGLRPVLLTDPDDHTNEEKELAAAQNLDHRSNSVTDRDSYSDRPKPVASALLKKINDLNAAIVDMERRTREANLSYFNNDPINGQYASDGAAYRSLAEIEGQLHKLNDLASHMGDDLKSVRGSQA